MALVTLVIVLLGVVATALNNGVGLTPAMGWCVLPQIGAAPSTQVVIYFEIRSYPIRISCHVNIACLCNTQELVESLRRECV